MKKVIASLVIGLLAAANYNADVIKGSSQKAENKAR